MSQVVQTVAVLLRMQVLRAHMLLPEAEVRELEALAARVAAADAAKANEEDILGEPPAEFLDALMDTLMEEPVILPKSRAVVDRSTINRCAQPSWVLFHKRKQAKHAKGSAVVCLVRCICRFWSSYSAPGHTLSVLHAFFVCERGL